MSFNAILACTLNHGIGYNNKLPWKNISEDISFFKEKTSNCTVIMGRKTFESLKRPLPNRINIVVSSTLKYTSEANYYLTRTFENALSLAYKFKNEIYCIGGSFIYSKALKHVNCKTVYITKVNKECKIDTFFDCKLLLDYYKLPETKISTDPSIHFETWEKNKIKKGWFN